MHVYLNQDNQPRRNDTNYWQAVRRQFLHSGYLGDVIYALPVIKALGGGALFLAHDPAFDFPPMGERAKALTALLFEQPYITGVYFELPIGDFCNLNSFRHQPNLLTYPIAYNHARANMLPSSIADEKWLYIPPSREHHQIIVARSQRHQSSPELYRRLMSDLPDQIAFVGLEIEYRAFVEEFGYVPWHGTNNLLDVAVAIGDCDLFVGNQSAAAAIAEGLKANMVVEVSPVAPNCSIARPNRVDWREYEQMDFSKVRC